MIGKLKGLIDSYGEDYVILWPSTLTEFSVL